MSKVLQLQQIIAGPFENTKNKILSYSLVGLSIEGHVYRYDPHCQGWLALGMTEATCVKEHTDRFKASKIVPPAKDYAPKRITIKEGPVEHKIKLPPKQLRFNQA